MSGSLNNGVTGDPFAAVRQVSIDQVAQLRQSLLDIHKLAPQARGYAFETFLQQLFEASNLQPRVPFRNSGEQIDGSFHCRGDIYLVEAKWVVNPVGAGELHILQGKISEKVAWARQVFISYYGFTGVGLQAFGRGKSLVCISGIFMMPWKSRYLSQTSLTGRCEQPPRLAQYLFRRTILDKGIYLNPRVRNCTALDHPFAFDLTTTRAETADSERSEAN